VAKSIPLTIVHAKEEWWWDTTVRGACRTPCVWGRDMVYRVTTG